MSERVVKEKAVAVAAKDVDVLVERAESEDGDQAVSVSTLTLRRANFAIKYFSYYMPRYHRHVELYQSMTPTSTGALPRRVVESRITLLRTRQRPVTVLALRA